IFGMLQRSGQLVIRMLADVKRKTIGPLIRRTLAPGTAVFPDEYDISARLPQGGPRPTPSATRRASSPGTCTFRNFLTLGFAFFPESSRDRRVSAFPAKPPRGAITHGTLGSPRVLGDRL